MVGWLWWSRSRTPTALALLTAQTAAGVVCFVSVLDLADTMLYGQLVFQAAFTASVVLGLGRELPARATVPSSVTSSVTSPGAVRTGGPATLTARRQKGACPRMGPWTSIFSSWAVGR